MPVVKVQRPTFDVAQPGQMHGWHQSAGAWFALTVDDNNELIANSHNRIWDTSALAWVAATGSLAGGASVEVVNFPAVQAVTGEVGILDSASARMTPAKEDTLSTLQADVAAVKNTDDQFKVDRRKIISGSKAYDEILEWDGTEYPICIIDPGTVNGDLTAEVAVNNLFWSFDDLGLTGFPVIVDGNNSRIEVDSITPGSQYVIDVTGFNNARIKNTDCSAGVYQYVLVSYGENSAMIRRLEGGVNNIYNTVSALTNGQQITHLLNIAGNQINPATEDTLATAQADIATIKTTQTDGNQKVQIQGNSGNTFAARTYANDAVVASNDTMLQVRANVVALNGSNSHRITGDANGLDVDVTRLPDFLQDESGSATNKILSDNIFLGAPVTVEADHHEIHCGDSYSLTRAVDVPNGASDWILVVVPNEAVKRFHLVSEFEAELESQFNIYEGASATFTGSSTLTWVNRERNSALTTGIKSYSSASISTTGTLIYARHIGSGRFVGGATRGSQEFVLKNNTKYLIQIQNSTANNNYISWMLGHYIHPGV